MDGVPPRPSRRNPFTQAKNQHARPILFPLPFPHHSGMKEDQSSTAGAVEVGSDLYAGVGFTDSVHVDACSIPRPQSPGLGVSIPTSVGNLHTSKAHELATPPTQDINTQHGGAVPVAQKKRKQLRVLRPASTRIRNPPKLLYVPEAKTPAEQPRKAAIKTCHLRIEKRKTITPALAVEDSTAGLWEEDQFMQLLRDTIESNKNARKRREAPLLTEDLSMYIPPGDDGDQSPGYLDMRSNRSIDATALCQGVVPIRGDDSEVARLSEESLRDASEEAITPTFKSEAHNRQIKWVQGSSENPTLVIDPIAEVLAPALGVIGACALFSPTLSLCNSRTIIPEAAMHGSSSTKEDPVLVPSG